MVLEKIIVRCKQRHQRAIGSDDLKCSRIDKTDYIQLHLDHIQITLQLHLKQIPGGKETTIQGIATNEGQMTIFFRIR